MEMAMVANATGFKAGRRGMYGPECFHVNEAANLFPMDQVLDGGLVDYILGAEPGPGVFVIGYNNHPIQQQYLNYYKMGQGPLYTFYTPCLCATLKRLSLLPERYCLVILPSAPIAGPVCDVITVAKRDLETGENLDGIGGFTCYGMLENSVVCRQENLLPMGLSEGCSLKRNIAMDQAISYEDVELPAGRLCDKLRAEQDEYFAQ